MGIQYLGSSGAKRIPLIDIQAPGPIMDNREWVAQCAARLAEHWHSETVDPSDLDNIALRMAEEPQYRAMPPRDAAVEWLRPVLGSDSA